VTNTGNIDLHDINVTDTLPDGNPGTLIMDNNGSGDDILNVGESWIYTLDYIVKQVEVDTGIDIVNEASVTTIELPKETDNAHTPVVGMPDFNVTKTQTAGPKLVTSAGQMITYAIDVNNTGTVSLTNVTLQEYFPGPVGHTISDPIESDVNNSILDVGESWRYITKYIVTQEDIDTKAVLLNTVVIETNEVGPKDANETTPVDQKPSFTVRKRTNSAPTHAGDTLVYYFDVNSTGNMSLKNVIVTDVKCAAPATYESGDINYNAILDVNEVHTYTCNSIAVTQIEVDTGIVFNEVNVTVVTPPGILIVGEGNRTTYVPENPLFTVVKNTTSIPTQVGDTLDYTFTVHNIGNVTLTDINLTDLKCATPIIYISGDMDGNSTILSVGEEQQYSCTSIGVTQGEIDAGEVYNEVSVTVKPPKGNPTPPVDANTTNPVPRASLGDKVWYDNNPNGIQDAGEHGVDKIKVYLLDGFGTRIQHNGADVFTETNSTGEYIFEMLLSGRDYAVEFDLSTLPTGHYEVTEQDIGVDERIDSDADTSTGKTDPVFLTAGQYYEDLDMGIKLMLAHIGDYFWIDHDQNSIQNSGESPVVGAKIELLDEHGNTVFDENGNDIVKTDINGYYGFDVLPGIYQIRFNIPATGYEGYVFSAKHQGKNQSIDSDVDVDGFTDTITVHAGDNNLTIDAGVNCGCENAPIKANGGDTLGLLGMLGMMLMTLCLGLFFVRKEEEQRV